ncbi:FDLD family class I lanthipeptide [Brevibacillus ruminantium]|uniref:FDLD family class I lanthipeptide n=1 Tax=Brevibacillus ruminantium TaxID=2950604 RepID=A0ABY4WDP1_9BACL|nr:FDLD family class I lanthipeptide [Brevibacillus ruminantium]USG63895.1 FDLD family class I lanthipeptide [Brevibacillus ruminantium]
MSKDMFDLDLQVAEVNCSSSSEEAATFTCHTYNCNSYTDCILCS